MTKQSKAAQQYPGLPRFARNDEYAHFIKFGSEYPPNMTSLSELQANPAKFLAQMQSAHNLRALAGDAH